MLLVRSVRSAATAGCIGAAGDLLMQSREHLPLTTQSVDPERSARIASFRALQAPIIDYAWRAFDAGLTARGGVLAAGPAGAAAHRFRERAHAPDALRMHSPIASLQGSK